MQTRGSSLFKSQDIENYEEEGEFDEFETFHRASKLKENGYHQYCNKVIMIEPTAFYTNEGCIVDNGFMKRIPLQEDLVQMRVILNLDLGSLRMEEVQSETRGKWHRSRVFQAIKIRRA